MQGKLIKKCKKTKKCKTLMTLPENSTIKTCRYERERKRGQEENNKETITLSQ